MRYGLHALIGFSFASTCPVQVPWWQQYNLKRLAVVTVPVADMLIKPARTYQKSGLPDSVYNHLPLSGETTDFPCVRAHQALFNEILTDTRLIAKECRGSIPDAWYGATKKTNKPLTTFYTQATNTRSLSFLARKGLDLNVIPPPSWASPTEHDTVVSLILPWSNRLTGQTYSAGTRFKRLKSEDQPTYHAVQAANYKTFSADIMYIPRGICLVEYQRSSERQRTLFMDVIKQWLAEETQGIVPYVLGGASIVHYYAPDKPFTLHKTSNEKLIWQRTDPHYPHTGIDCASLIWRAARIVGIPYWHKNTSTLARFLTPLERGSDLREGDLIWTPGHVMIVGSQERQELIEAGGYESSGYGQLHAVPLSRRIAGTTTYSQLLEAYHSHKPLVLLKKDGTAKPGAQFTIFRLLKE